MWFVPRRMSRFVLLAAVLSLLAAFLPMSPASAQGGQMVTNCSVTSGDGGVTVSFDALPVTVDYYVYRIESDGNPDRYGQTNDTTVFVPLTGDARIFMGAFVSGVGYTPAVDCGSGNGGNGGDGGTLTCSLESAAGGVRASWDAIAGAETYVWRLEVAQQSNRYGRNSGTSAIVPVATGVTAKVFVSAVLSDGSYTPAVACGSATGGGEAPDNSPTCKATSADGGVRATWSTVPGADRYVYRYILSSNPNVARYASTPGSRLTDVVSAPAGTQVSVWVSGQRADGTYTGAVPCGSATAGGTAPGANCTFQWFPRSDVTASFSWNAVPGNVTGYTVTLGQFVIFNTPGTSGDGVFRVDPGNLPAAGTIVVNFSDRAPITEPCVVTNSLPAPTLPVPNAMCETVPDTDGSDMSIFTEPSAAGVESYVYIDLLDFNSRFGTFRIPINISPQRSQGTFGTFGRYQEVVNGATTQLLSCSERRPDF